MKTIQKMALEVGGMFTELPMMDAWVFDANDKSLEAFAKLVEAPLRRDIEELLQENTLLRARNDRLEAELIAQTQQEPVTKVIGKFLTRKDELRTCIEPELPLGTSLYTSPPQRTWVGLTEEDKQIAFDSTQEGGGFWEFADAIEAKLKEKNT